LNFWQKPKHNNLQELKLYSYVQVVGGNKHREGFRYKLTQFGNQTEVQNRIEKDLKNTLDKIKKKHEKLERLDTQIIELKTESKTVSQKQVSNSKTQQS